MDFMTLGRQCAPMADPHILMAIVRTESAFRPYAIGVNGGHRLVRQPETQDEAVALATDLIGRGYSIDLGLAQINSANLSVLGLSVADAFDPCKNINAAARLFKSDYRRALSAGHAGDGALVAALSAYNTGSFTKGVHNGYVRKVLANLGDAAKQQISFSGDLPVISPVPEKSASPLLAHAAEASPSGVMVYAAGSRPCLIFQP